MKTGFLGVFQINEDAEVIEDENAFPVSARERGPCPSQGTGGSPSSEGTNCNRWLEETEKTPTSFRERRCP